jgi:hypothetical protein
VVADRRDPGVTPFRAPPFRVTPLHFGAHSPQPWAAHAGLPLTAAQAHDHAEARPEDNGEHAPEQRDCAAGWDMVARREGLIRIILERSDLWRTLWPAMLNSCGRRAARFGWSELSRAVLAPMRELRLPHLGTLCAPSTRNARAPAAAGGGIRHAQYKRPLTEGYDRLNALALRPRSYRPLFFESATVGNGGSSSGPPFSFRARTRSRLAART